MSTYNCHLRRVRCFWMRQSPVSLLCWVVFGVIYGDRSLWPVNVLSVRHKALNQALRAMCPPKPTFLAGFYGKQPGFLGNPKTFIFSWFWGLMGNLYLALDLSIVGEGCFCRPRSSSFVRFLFLPGMPLWASPWSGRGLSRGGWGCTPWKFNGSPLKIYHPKRRVVFQPSFFRGYVKLRGCSGDFRWIRRTPLNSFDFTGGQLHLGPSNRGYFREGSKEIKGCKFLLPLKGLVRVAEYPQGPGVLMVSCILTVLEPLYQRFSHLRYGKVKDKLPQESWLQLRCWRMFFLFSPIAMHPDPSFGTFSLLDLGESNLEKAELDINKPSFRRYIMVFPPAEWTGDMNRFS